MLPWLTEQDMLEKAKIGKKIKGVAPSCTLNIHVTVDSHSYFDRVKPMVLVLPTSPDHTHHWTWVALQAHPSCTKTTLSTSMSKCWLWWKKTHLQTKYQIIRAILVPIFVQVKDSIALAKKFIWVLLKHLTLFLWWKDVLTALLRISEPTDICPSTTQMFTILALVLGIPHTNTTTTPPLIHRYSCKTRLAFSSIFLWHCLSNQINSLKIETRSLYLYSIYLSFAYRVGAQHLLANSLLKP